MTMRYAVIPTRGRPDDLMRCVESIWEQTDHIVVVDNNDIPAVVDSDPKLHTVHFPEQPPNLSALWNMGMRKALELHIGRTQDPRHDIAILNDDAIAPAGWFDAMSKAMRDNDCAAASQHPFSARELTIWRENAPFNVVTRVTGWAFVLRGEKGMRFDPQFQWWCGDDDISARARAHGGLVHVPGFPVQNVHANKSTVGVLADIAAQDMARFVGKWGKRPW